jgi:cytochrome c oxidase assembly protein subunit 15
MKKYFLTAAKTTLILVYLVIVAGAAVRMTGSGMGCPDWPKCFGYYVPPSDIAELTWSSNREFESGQVIIKDEALLVAKDDFKTGATFDQTHWRPYTKHDYANFNPTHTWIEYVNRLVGALAGVATFAMAIFSFGFWRENKRLTILSWLAVFLMGFQGWLGAKVVYSVLNPVKITVHMVVALVIVALVLYIIRKASGTVAHLKFDRFFNNILVVALLLSLIQIVLGTQVRQFVDEQLKLVGDAQMQLVLQNPNLTFYVHRSFSIVVLLANLLLFLRNKRLQLGFAKTGWIIGLIALEIASGFAMYEFDFPFGLQAVHLVLASVLFGIQFYVLLESKDAKKGQ